MKTENNEAIVYLRFMDRIAQICTEHRLGIEWEDSVAEASYIFLCTMRTPGINEKTLWSSFVDTLFDAIKELIKNADNSRYKSESLDASRNSCSGSGSYTLMDILQNPQGSKSYDKVWDFLDTLPAEEREACEAAIFDRSKRSNIALNKSCKMQTDLQKRYMEFDSNYIW